MSYPVKDYMRKKVETIDHTVTVTEAAKVMASNEDYSGYVIILKKGRPVGIVTERNIIKKVLARDLDPSKIMISEIMSVPLLTVDPDDELLKAAKLMQDNNVRKIAVIRNDIIYGIVTTKDITQHFSEYIDRSIKDIIRWTTRLGF
jgi:CBS domain-containing protein